MQTDEQVKTGGNTIEVTGKGSKVKIEGTDIAALGGAEHFQIKGALAGFAEFLQHVTDTAELSALGITSAQMLDVIQHQISQAIDVATALKKPVNSQPEIDGRNQLADWVRGLQRTQEPGLPPIYKAPIEKIPIVPGSGLPPV